MFNDNTQGWYAIFVHTGEEDRVKERLQYRFNDCGIRVLVPKRKLRERKNGIWEYKTRTLFPGYVLVNGAIGIEEYYLTKGIPGLIKVLKDKSDLLRIEEHEIDVINRLIVNSEIIGTSSIFIDGSRVIVSDGPLLGMDGLVESINKRKGRAKVRLDFLGESRLIELSINLLQPA